MEDKKTREEDLEEQLLKLQKENKELKERPIEVNASPSDEDISKLRQELEKEITEQAEQKAKTELAISSMVLGSDISCWIKSLSCLVLL